MARTVPISKPAGRPRCGRGQSARRAFDKLHPDIYNPDFWLDMQRQLNAGVVHDVFPYRKKQRFTHHMNDSGF